MNPNVYRNGANGPAILVMLLLVGLAALAIWAGASWDQPALHGLAAVLLICAALVHDLGKTREFTYGAEIALSEEGRLLGHVVLGQQILDARAGSMSAERRLALAHCVLTHHGAEGAPGRRFGSPEALALYRLNALDASVKGALEHGLP